MIKKHFFIILNFYFLFVSPEFICPKDFQIDTLANTSESSSDSLRNFIFNFNRFSEFETSNLFLPDLPDSLIIQLQVDFLRKQPDQNYLFQSSMSEQWRINGQLRNYIDFRKELALKSDLGIFGKVLSNARTITALVLAILHVFKYRKGLY